MTTWAGTLTILVCQVWVQPPERFHPVKSWNVKRNKEAWRPKITYWRVWVAAVLRLAEGEFLTRYCRRNQQCILSQQGQNQFLMEDQREREREGGQRRKGKQWERKGDAVAAECGESTKWWQWRIRCSSVLPSKGLFHFILLGHIHIKGSLSVWECVGECCVCGVNASRSAWRWVSVGKAHAHPCVCVWCSNSCIRYCHYYAATAGTETTITISEDTSDVQNSRR